MIDIYIDGADLSKITHYAADPEVKGFTTNPSLLKAAGVTNYAEFGKVAAAAALGKPISFEVLADDLPHIEAQAQTISRWGSNVFVKVPITTTKKDSTRNIVRRLLERGVCVNVTAVMTVEQVQRVNQIAAGLSTPCIVSVFCGRIADTGRDPVEVMREVESPLLGLWASPRSIGDVLQAEHAGADIITLTPDLFEKRRLLANKNLDDYSRETVIQFFVDGMRSGLTLGEAS